MKKCYFLLPLILWATIAQAQDAFYYLQEADTPGHITINEPYELRRVNELKIKWNQLEEGIEGYRIQIYMGRSREDAIEARKTFQNNYPDISADLVFENPYVKIRVGEFRNRIEAQELYFKLLDQYESVIIIKVKNMRYPKL